MEQRSLPALPEQSCTPFAGREEVEDLLSCVREDLQFREPTEIHPLDILEYPVGLRGQTLRERFRGQNQVDHMAMEVPGDGIHDPEQFAHTNVQVGLLEEFPF